ncbi:L-arabinose transport system permease protein AraP [bioreactor metagenome]|uniref:L-arabinose transport system permease protein AraP n=1 Tax=bioreactor metagenome TaxID=1076179 RepID=A0A645ED09_9ZZZZ
MPARGFFRAVFYIPYILPATAVMISWWFLLKYDGGLINSILVSLGLGKSYFLSAANTAIPSLAMIAVWTSGNLIVIFLAGLQNVPRVYHEAAEIDGANAWQRFWNITIPCMTPIIFYNLLMSLVVNLQVVVPALAVTKGGPGKSTMFMTYLMYQTGFRGRELGQAGAIAFVFFIVAAILAFILFATSKSWIYNEGGDDQK